MTTVANCYNLTEALQLQMFLEAAGIASFIPDENTASVAPHHFLTNSGVRLQVSEDDAAEALQLIAETKKDS
jgi:hypothetical protein